MTDTAEPGPHGPTPSTEPRTRGAERLRAAFRSRAWRFAVMILLTVLMGIPLMMVAAVIGDRVSYKRQATAEIARQWGGPVQIAGVVMVLPVQRTITTESGGGMLTERSRTRTEAAEPIMLLPEHLGITAEAVTEVRRRGIFEVPVFAAEVVSSIVYDIARVSTVLEENETVLWDQAMLAIVMPGARSFAGRARLRAGDRSLDLEPGTPMAKQSGIQAAIGDPRGVQTFTLTMRLNGTRSLSFAPTGRMTEVAMTSTWPDPSFNGQFLPKSRDVSDAGFTASWEVPHLARDLPQAWRGEWRRTASFGVSLFNPVDLYQQVERAAKYGILFIALTFLTVFLIERLSARPAHPAQLILIGIAQCVFFLLLLSIAEQVGFQRAYAGAAGATIVLVGLYGRSALGLGQATWILVGALAVLYGVLYLILRSTDYALLAGSVLAFAAVALAMAMTRGDDWSGQGGNDPNPHGGQPQPV